MDTQIYLRIEPPLILNILFVLCLHNLIIIIIKIHRPLKYNQYEFDIVLAGAGWMADSVLLIPFYSHPSQHLFLHTRATAADVVVGLAQSNYPPEDGMQ